MTIISRCIPGIDGGKDRVGFSPPPHTKNKISKSTPHRLIVLHKDSGMPSPSQEKLGMQRFVYTIPQDISKEGFPIALT